MNALQLREVIEIALDVAIRSSHLGPTGDSEYDREKQRCYTFATCLAIGINRLDPALATKVAALAPISGWLRATPDA